MEHKQVYVIRNQLKQYLDKHSGWHSGKEANTLFRVNYHDEALNALIEINAKDINLRGEIIAAQLDEKKRPIVEISESALALDQTAINIDDEVMSEDATSESSLEDEN